MDRSGWPRNTGYLTRVLVDSAPARLLAENDRVLVGPPEIEGLSGPDLARLIRTRMRRFGQETGVTGGNSTKQIRFDFTLPHSSVIQTLRLRKTVIERGPHSSDHAEPVGPILTISDDPAVVGGGFDVWRNAILDGARRDGDLWVRSTERFVFRNQPDRKSLELGARTALGIDPTGSRWAVQINEANVPGDLNVTSAIATDQAGRIYLVRQGRLKPGPDEEEILYEDFRRWTKLRPVTVTNGNTKINRDWYIVTPLDVPPHEMCRNTARFIDACAVARSRGVGVSSPADLDVSSELNASDEAGGTFVVGAKDAQDAKLVRRWQGEVWTAMAKLLRGAGFEVDKPMPAGRYEVDAEIVRGNCKLLVEIKTSASAADVYGGVGQLAVYAKLLPRLASHTPVLLLPDLPHPLLNKALAECGITICTFDLTEEEDGINTEFSDAFLSLCGVLN